MQKFIVFCLLSAFCACKNASTEVPKNPKEVAIYYWTLANDGIKGDTAKYSLYRQSFVQNTNVENDLFGVLLIYSTAKATRKGTVKLIQNVGEKAIIIDGFEQIKGFNETLRFTFEDGSTDTIVTKLVLENNIWKLKWQNGADFEHENK